jgi:hypothetical protein
LLEADAIVSTNTDVDASNTDVEHIEYLEYGVKDHAVVTFAVLGTYGFVQVRTMMM